MKRTVKQFLEEYLPNRNWKDKSTETACNDGWYDWFCKDSALAGRLKKMSNKIKQIARSPKIDQDKMYIFFKNNCPMNGNLYDDFRFCDLATHKVVYTIIPRSGFDVAKGRAEVWGKENNFKESLVEGTWNDIIEFFLK